MLLKIYRYRNRKLKFLHIWHLSIHGIKSLDVLHVGSLHSPSSLGLPAGSSLHLGDFLVVEVGISAGQFGSAEGNLGGCSGFLGVPKT